MKSVVTWKAKLAFEAKSRGHAVVMDTSVAQGGTDQGQSPKELVLAAICGCTGMDVVSYLKKSDTKLSNLTITAEAEQTKPFPRVFEQVNVTFEASGDAAAGHALVEAARESMTLYCGVSAMIAKACPIVYRVVLDGNVLVEARAKFP